MHLPVGGCANIEEYCESLQMLCNRLDLLHVARRAEHVNNGKLNEQISVLSDTLPICMRQRTKAAVKNRQVIHNALLVHNDTAAISWGAPQLMQR